MKSVPAPTVIAVIPARYFSQRLPGKPLVDIAGKPMIQHVYERALAASLINEVLVATDDERILDAVAAFGGYAAMTPADIQSGTDRIAHIARSLQGADIIVNIQGDEPLISPDMIDEAIRPMIQDRSLTTTTLVRRIESEAELHNPNLPKVVIDNDGSCLYFSRSVVPFLRDADGENWIHKHNYYKHIGLYVFRRDFLLRYAQLPQTPLEKAEKLEQLRILEHGFQIKAVVTSHDSISVDTAEDLEQVRAKVSQV
jgi:3-deoxy-manno-octulosonate cytidylyltransferase (CMP-KDO synthetase)